MYWSKTRSSAYILFTSLRSFGVCIILCRDEIVKGRDARWRFSASHAPRKIRPEPLYFFGAVGYNERPRERNPRTTHPAYKLLFARLSPRVGCPLYGRYPVRGGNRAFRCAPYDKAQHVLFFRNLPRMKYNTPPLQKFPKTFRRNLHSRTYACIIETSNRERNPHHANSF